MWFDYFFEAAVTVYLVAIAAALVWATYRRIKMQIAIHKTVEAVASISKAMDENAKRLEEENVQERNLVAIRTSLMKIFNDDQIQLKKDVRELQKITTAPHDCEAQENAKEAMNAFRQCIGEIDTIRKDGRSNASLVAVAVTQRAHMRETMRALESRMTDLERRMNYISGKRAGLLPLDGLPMVVDKGPGEKTIDITQPHLYRNEEA